MRKGFLKKGLSEPEFERQYGNEEQCRDAVGVSRWPDGFRCPECGGKQYSLVKSRDLFQCTACRRQTSPIAGTIFASTKLALCLWFRALYHVTQSKQGISSIELGRRLGVTQTTAWKIKHKLNQVMLERDAGKPLTGRIELDDAYLGGERTGGKFGGAERSGIMDPSITRRNDFNPDMTLIPASSRIRCTVIGRTFSAQFGER